MKIIMNVVYQAVGLVALIGAVTFLRDGVPKSGTTESSICSIKPGRVSVRGLLKSYEIVGLGRRQATITQEGCDLTVSGSPDIIGALKEYSGTPSAYVIVSGTFKDGVITPDSPLRVEARDVVCGIPILGAVESNGIGGWKSWTRSQNGSYPRPIRVSERIRPLIPDDGMWHEGCIERGAFDEVVSVKVK
jgi:hypothetical protein